MYDVRTQYNSTESFIFMTTLTTPTHPSFHNTDNCSDDQQSIFHTRSSIVLWYSVDRLLAVRILRISTIKLNNLAYGTEIWFGRYCHIRVKQHTGLN